MGRLVENTNFESALSWFEQFGRTDAAYLSAHFDRFLKTKDFALQGAQQSFGPRTILDVGAHWLHNAFLYANDGHKLICVDAPNTLTLPSVKRAAEAMGAILKPSEHLEFGDGIQDVKADSIDVVLFCEIIEHITFNPIIMWKTIYRVLKPGGSDHCHNS
jgi:2-polyprenyl-3-methyl-5-hydroxy-6-metoxy-1,4-benzoquinol methylase